VKAVTLGGEVFMSIWQHRKGNLRRPGGRRMRDKKKGALEIEKERRNIQ